MLKNNLSDTIVAISTPIGESGIGIVRISGKDALEIADRIFASKNGKKPSEFKTYTTHYGWIVETRDEAMPAGRQGRMTKDAGVVDEVILTVMRVPRSYTKWLCAGS
jgi:tRNA modification GTPase